MREDKSCHNDYNPSKDKLEIGVWMLVDYYKDIKIICFIILLSKMTLFVLLNLKKSKISNNIKSRGFL